MWDESLKQVLCLVFCDYCKIKTMSGTKLFPLLIFCNTAVKCTQGTNLLSQFSDKSNNMKKLCVTQKEGSTDG
jgi:hypothetical protein